MIGRGCFFVNFGPNSLHPWPDELQFKHQIPTPFCNLILGFEFI
jgi:hypothetical protein